MSHDADYLLALEIQKRWNAQNNESDDDIVEVSYKPPTVAKAKPNESFTHKFQKSPHNKSNSDYLNQTQNLVHPEWETLDPTPDIYALFAKFDDRFFQGRLKCVTLEWSKRMYSCAGICYSRRQRGHMDITIRLSQPLLTLRPRKDLVETMLHEMIHAFCFIMNIREGNGGHGPVFKKIMHNINKVAGTNITVYHSFHDEVNVYKQHVWRCSGICQNRGPFYGYVKRTSNRAPGPNDQWWSAHQQSCGGTFVKVKEPEKRKKPTKEPTKAKPLQKKSLPASGSGDLRKFFNSNKTNSPLSNSSNNNSNIKGISNTAFKGPIKINGGGTMLLNPKTKSQTKTNTNQEIPSFAKSFPPSSYPGLSTDPFNANIKSSPSNKKTVLGGNLHNVKGFRDLNSSGSEAGGGGGGNSGRAISGFPKQSPNSSMFGKGHSLVSSANNNNRFMPAAKNNAEGEVDKNHLREVWLRRFGATSSNNLNGDSKRRRLSNEANSNGFKANEFTKSSDIIALTSSSDEETDDYSNNILNSQKYSSSDERQKAIKQEIVNDSIQLEHDDIILIDDEYDDNIVIGSELADTSIIDEFFGDDTLLKEFKEENDNKPTGSKHNTESEEIISCPICAQKMKRYMFDNHMDGCSGITDEEKQLTANVLDMYASQTQDKSKNIKKSFKQKAKEMLLECGYTEDDIKKVPLPSSDEE